MTKFFDALLGRTKQVPPNLDALFGLPSAAITLQVEAGLVSSGQAGVCFKPVAEASFDQVQGDMTELLTMLRTQNELQLSELDDKLGYHWVVLTDPDINTLVTNVHLVNSSLQDAGFGPRLLCSVFGFTSAAGHPSPRHPYLVYLFKRGTFYPFAPISEPRRDNEYELHLKGILAKDLRVEEDLARWFPVWGVPVA
ncbi:MAG: hypothetical protein NVSMB32_06310 [Actinomycetota bacterium]